jgi:hypothetical protein
LSKLKVQDDESSFWMGHEWETLVAVVNEAKTMKLSRTTAPAPLFTVLKEGYSLRLKLIFKLARKKIFYRVTKIATPGGTKVFIEFQEKIFYC